MGKAELKPACIPVLLDGESIINRPVTIHGEKVNINCCSVGNAHCVVFVDNVDRVDVAKIGPQFENAPIFPERINTEFVRVVNSNTLKMRVWERGTGETLACGTGACATAVACHLNGLTKRHTNIELLRRNIRSRME